MPCPHLEAVRGISLQPGLGRLALLSFFINHPLPPPDPVCPASLNLLQFVSSEWCRVLPARPGVAVLRFEGKEGPFSICRQAPLLGSAGFSPSSFLTEQLLNSYFLSFMLKCQVGRPRLCHGLSPGACAVFLCILQAPQKKPMGSEMDSVGWTQQGEQGLRKVTSVPQDEQSCAYSGEEEPIQRNSVCKHPVVSLCLTCEGWEICS